MRNISEETKNPIIKSDRTRLNTSSNVINTINRANEFSLDFPALKAVYNMFQYDTQADTPEPHGEGGCDIWHDNRGGNSDDGDDNGNVLSIHVPRHPYLLLKLQKIP